MVRRDAQSPHWGCAPVAQLPSEGRLHELSPKYCVSMVPLNLYQFMKEAEYKISNCFELRIKLNW